MWWMTWRAPPTSPHHCGLQLVLRHLIGSRKSCSPHHLMAFKLSMNVVYTWSMTWQEFLSDPCRLCLIQRGHW